MSLDSPLRRWLEGLGAHQDVIEFFAPYGSDFIQAYRDLDRGDWLLGLASRLVDDRGALVRAAAAVARVAESALDRDRVGGEAIELIEAAEDWAALRRNGEELVAKADALEKRAEELEDPRHRFTLLAASSAARSAADPEAAPMTAYYVMEALLAAHGGEDDAMERVAEIHQLTAKAAKMHLPPELMRTPFKAH
ncbi:MAG: hypothetical protein GX614_04645 [Sandaracinaceae bacterium]|nr:hypothetical protein [Sandaracinaceae bacterium]